MAGEIDLLLVGQFLVVEHHDRIPVDRRLDGVAVGRLQRLGEVEAGDLGHEVGRHRLTVMLITGSCGYSGSDQPISPRKRHAANPQARPARRLSEGRHAHGRLGPPEEARCRDHGLPRAVLLGRGCRQEAGALRHAGPAARAHGLSAGADREAAQPQIHGADRRARCSLDDKAATERGIPISNTPGGGSNASTAELAGRC